MPVAFSLNLSADWAMFVNAGIGWNDLAQNARAGKGYARYTPTAATTLATTPPAGAVIPAEARHAVISVATNPIRFRTDGTNPTNAEGLLLPVGLWIFENQRPLLDALRFIDSSAGASEVTVMYGI